MATSVFAGDTISLRALFKDDLGDTVSGTNIYVHIFEPDEVIDPLNLSNAYVISGSPSYLGEGIFEYDFVPPATEGTWQHYWEGDLSNQSVSGLFEFIVATSGTVESYCDQLFSNNVVEVTLLSGLAALDGSALQVDYEFSFMTDTVPSYSSIRKVRLEIGNYISNLYDDVIQTAILEASIETDVLTFYTDKQNTPLYEHARRQYVTCMAALMLLTGGVTAHALRSKTLADLRVEYDPNAIRDTISDLKDCLARWEGQVIAGGYAKSAAQPKGVVKGELDPDRPTFARLWESTDGYSVNRRTPGANHRQTYSNRRRGLATWKKRRW